MSFCSPVTNVVVQVNPEEFRARDLNPDKDMQLTERSFKRIGSIIDSVQYLNMRERCKHERVGLTFGLRIDYCLKPLFNQTFKTQIGCLSLYLFIGKLAVSSSDGFKTKRKCFAVRSQLVHCDNVNSSSQ